MNLRLNFMIFTLICLIGCASTSEESKEIAKTVIDTANTLNTRHLQTIDAYIASLEAAKDDMNVLLSAIRTDRSQIRTLKTEMLGLRTEALVGQALQAYDSSAYTQVLSQLDEALNKTYWPSIEAKVKEAKVKEAMFSSELTSHICNRTPDNCTGAVFLDYKQKAEMYRQYGIQAEYIAHLGYDGVANIWQKVVTQYEQHRQAVKIKALDFLAKEPKVLSISNDQLESEITQVSNNLDEVIRELQQEKSVIKSQWDSTKNALNLLQQEINKPAIWKLVLNGASSQAKGIIAGYSESVSKGISGILGDDLGGIVGDATKSMMNTIAENGVNKLNAAVNGFIAKGQEKLSAKADAFNDKPAAKVN